MYIKINCIGINKSNNLKNLTMKKLLLLIFTANNISFSIAQTWIQRADITGFMPRIGASAFSIGTKVYIGTGSDGMAAMYKDLWEWTPGVH